MTKNTDVHEKLAHEKRELNAAVAELKDEISETAKRAKKILGTATGAAVVVKLALKLKRRRGSA